MLKKSILFAICFFFLTGCGQPRQNELEKVGLLVPDTISDQVWGTKGYKGLLKIQSSYGIEVFYKEGMNNQEVVREAVKEFSGKGVNLIFGHGSEYEAFFAELNEEYDDIHFVFFNGEAKGDNMTSLNFDSNAMGFFGGMIAGEMTKTNKVGILAAYEWQPEIDGFYEGANYQNPDVQVEIQYVQSWDDVKSALNYTDEMLAEGIDVVYPAGDGYNVPVIERIKEKGQYAIGFVSDQSDLGKTTVLTSTIQHVDRLYELVAEKYLNGELESGNLYFDFQDDVIELGKYSPNVDKAFQNKIQEHIEIYRQTDKLPNQF
ncbi:MAG: BMP family ABC transporter substrate-binding protein [Bacillota bacterium]